ncbi:MAG: class I SAM-dependent methyltransferase [Candidatus Methanomethylicia archaeon]
MSDSMGYTFNVKRSVMDVFSSIAYEFDVTRVKPWSEVYLLSRFGGLIVDLGCGSGRHSIALVNEGCEVLAVDISPVMVKLCLSKVRFRESYRFINGVVCDINFLPFRSCSIDHALCLATIHHIPLFKCRVDALNEIFRVLRKFGILVLSVWALYQYRFFKLIPKMLFNRFLRRVKEYGDVYIPWKSRGGVYLRFHHLFSRREFLRLCRSSKFHLAYFYGKSFRKTRFSENHVAILFKP